MLRVRFPPPPPPLNILSPPPPLNTHYPNPAEDDVETYEKRFSGFIEKGITAENIEEMYANALEKIRENPVKKPAPKYKRTGKELRKQPKLSLEARKERVAAKKVEIAAKLKAALAAANAGDEEEEEEEEEEE